MNRRMRARIHKIKLEIIRLEELIAELRDLEENAYQYMPDRLNNKEVSLKTIEYFTTILKKLKEIRSLPLYENNQAN